MPQPVPLRRKDRATDEAEALALLERGEWGVLATADADGVPLATPLSYVLRDGHIYFHCAHTGHKLANIGAQPAVCFTVVGATQPVYDHNFTTRYESVVAHGTAARVQDEAERRAALLALCQKYLPAHMDKADAAITGSGPATEVVRITVAHLSGKARR